MKSVDLNMARRCQKKNYTTSMRAFRVAMRLDKLLKADMYPYKCPYCKYWHLTTHPRGGKPNHDFILKLPPPKRKTRKDRKFAGYTCPR